MGCFIFISAIFLFGSWYFMGLVNYCLQNYKLNINSKCRFHQRGACRVALETFGCYYNNFGFLNEPVSALMTHNCLKTGIHGTALKLFETLSVV